MCRILLVEDSAPIRDMLTRRLVKRSFEVIHAGDGASACDLARQVRPDVILMDLHLPVLDGWEATRRIKTAPDTGAIPVIALTADAMQGDREKAMAAGCDDYETKPIELPRLLEKIGRLTGLRDCS